jgi:hypothetical protein
MIMNIDLWKVYDRVSSLYLILMKLHVGFSLEVVKWVMGYVSSISFVLPINHSTSKNLNPSRGLK